MTVEIYVSTTRHSYTQARRHARLPADFPVRVRGDGVRLSDRARDISEAGIGIETSRPLVPMMLVSLSLEVPHSRVPVDVLGRVMWASGQMMGIRFEQSDPLLADALDRLRQDFERI